MQLLVCVIRTGSEYRAIVSQCGRRASDRWGKLSLSLDMITAGGMCVCVGVWVVVRFVWESWLTDFLGNVRLHAHDYAQVSMTVISNGDKCKTKMHI